MAPWCNRIKNAAFAFRREKIFLKSNLADGTAIHGDVRDRQWIVEHRDSDRITARLDSRAFPDFNFPFALIFRQSVRIAASHLTWSFSIENKSCAPVPIGFGLHPFFLQRIEGESGELSVRARRRYPSRCAVPTGDPKPLRKMIDSRRSLDFCVTEIRGPLTMKFPRQGFEWQLVLGKGFDHVYLYTPPSRKDLLCVEPMTMCVDGFNRLARGKRDTGVRLLRAGQRWSARVELRLRVYSRTSSPSPV